MANKAPEQERNYTQENYDEGFNNSGLSDTERGRLGGVYAKRQDDIDARRESMGNLRDSEEGVSSPSRDTDIQSQEESPTYAGGWENKTTQKSISPQKLSVTGLLKGKKNKSSVAAIIILLLIGGIFGLSFVTPGLLLIHMKETVTDRLNTQLASMDMRTEKVLVKKLSGQATSGFCTSKVTIRCKLTSFSDKQVKNLERAGIKVVSEGDTTITGRVKPTALEFNGKTLTGANLAREMRADGRLGAALNRGYNPKLAGFADKIWGKFADIFDISKAPIFDGSVATDEERDEKIKKQSVEGRDTGGSSLFREGENGEWRNDLGEVVDEDEAIRRNEAHSAQLGAGEIEGQLREGAGEVSESGNKASSSIVSEADEVLKAASHDISLTRVTGFFSLWGVADATCSVYGGIQAVAYGAKTIRAFQMGQYAMNFLTMADMMKAGDASPEDVAYFADILTKTVNKEVWNEKTNQFETVTTKAATDSFGYKYAAYGDVGPPSASATQFLAGGGLGGELSNVSNDVLNIVPGGKEALDKTCDVVRNPFVQTTGVVAGIALMLVPGAGQAFAGWKTGLQVGVGLTLSAATIVLPNLLDDLVAGVLIDDSVFGELAGDAFVSGSGVIMSGVAGFGGNAPLHPDQAVAYMGTQNEVIARYSEQERLDSSPLDGSNPHTFMGKIVGQLLPLTSKKDSIIGYASAAASVATRSFSSIIAPSTKALSAEDYMVCQDYDYQELKLATDPFCNPIRGIPPEYLDIDPLDIVEELDNKGHIDSDSGEPKSADYKKFIKNCIDRTEPFGENGEGDSSGEECFIDGDAAQIKERVYFYLYHIDRRVIDGMENGYELGTGSGGGETDMSNWPTAEDINKLVERAESGTGNSSPLHGKGGAFIELGKKYGINPGIIAAILYRESQMGADGSVLPNQYNNFAGITDAGGSAPGPCGSTPVVVDRTWKNFCTPEEGLEGVFQILDLDIYRNTNGTMNEVMELYSPKFENDWNDMWSIFRTVASELKITIEGSTNIYSAFAAGESAGLLAVAGSTAIEAIYEFIPGAIVDCDLYDYGKAYGTNGCQHTGTDIVLPKHAPIYSPVSGTVTCARTGVGPGTNGGGCSAFNSYSPDDVRHGRIEIELDNGDALILGHISTSMVEVGDRVSVGQQVGTNGYMRSWHVHVEYRTPDSSTSTGWRVINPADGLDGVASPGRNTG